MEENEKLLRPLQISIDTELLKRIDADPEAREKGRSAFIRSAVQLYFTVKERREIEARLTHAYIDKADEMLDEIADLLSAQSWPENRAAVRSGFSTCRALISDARF